LNAFHFLTRTHNPIQLYTSIASSALSRPDLFQAIVLHSPFVDVLSSMLLDELPLTRSEYLEWGNPLKSQEVYKSILQYCPVEMLRKMLLSEDNIAKLPNMLVTAGMRDQRTPIWQTAKFVAMYRNVLTQRGIPGRVLFNTGESAGHFGDPLEGQAGRVSGMSEEVTYLLDEVTG
jgi:oligopeptidase B